jgi:ubiquilin
MKAEEMRLIFKGKILKDEMTLDEYKITDGLTIHLVKGKTAGGAQPPATAASDSGTSASTGAGAGAAGAGIGLGGAAQPNPFAGGGFGGGSPFGGMGGMGGMGGGGMPPGMGGMPGGQMPSPEMMQQMMSNPMV